MKALRKSPSVILTLFFLYSCLTIEQDIWLRPDSSGLTRIKYKIPASLFADEETQRRLSYQIPVTPEKIREKFSKMSGIKIKKIKNYLTREKMKVIEAVLEFDHIKDLSDGVLNFSVDEDENYKTLYISITRNVKKGDVQRGRALNVEELVKQNLEKYQYSLAIHFPSAVVENEGVEKTGKREIRWSVPFNEIYSGGSPLQGKIKYKGEINLWERFLNLFIFLHAWL